MDSPRPQRTWRRKLAIACGSLVVFFALAEGLLRLAGYPRSSGVRWIADDALGQIPAPDQGWIENETDRAAGREPFKIRINSHSLRGADFPLAKPAGEKRVLVVGDSLTFGAGIDEEEAFPARLEAALAERAANSASGERVHVINAGINGASSWTYSRFVAERAFAFEPDVLVVAIFFGNDMEPERRLPRMGPAWFENACRRTATFDWLFTLYFKHGWKRVQAWRSGKSVADVEAELAAYTGGAQSVHAPDELLARWRKDAFPALVELGELARSRSLPLVVLALPSYVVCRTPKTPGVWSRWRDELAQLGLDVIDAEPWLRELGDDAWLAWDHGHLDEQGCERVGRGLAAELERRGLPR